MKKLYGLLTAFLVLFIFFITACKNEDSDLRIAEVKVLEFRQLISRNEFDYIYDHASEKFKEATDKKTAVDFLKGVSIAVANPDDFVLVEKKTIIDSNYGLVYVLNYRRKDNNTVEGYAFVKKDNELLLANYNFYPDRSL
jgi:hypothetical protein